jgi:hypothetical protein
MKSSAFVFAACLIFASVAAAQDYGLIYCGAQASPKFTVPVRTEPGRGLVVENANCGEQVKVLGIEQGYAKVTTWYSLGYVSLEFVQLAARVPKPGMSYGRGITECDGAPEVPVYGDILGLSTITKLACSQPVNFVEMERGFVRVLVGDRTGYVAAKFIRMESRNVEHIASQVTMPVVQSPSYSPGDSVMQRVAFDQPKASTGQASMPYYAASVANTRIPAGTQPASSDPQPPVTPNPSRSYPAANSNTNVPPGSRIFLTKMEGNLDGFLATEIIKKKLPVVIVMDYAQADFVLVGASIPEDLKWYLGTLRARDKNEGNVQLYSVNDKTVVWAGEAGDRSMWWGNLRRGGQRKLADRMARRMRKDLFKGYKPS